MINPVQLACLYHLFWYHFWPALMSFLMVLESRFWGGALFSATAGLPTQWAHSCWWLSNIKGWTLGKLQQKHVFKSDNRNNLALTTTHLSLWAGYTDPPAPRKDLEQKMKSQRSAWKFSWKEWRRHQKNAPPPPHKIWFAACDTKIQASHKSYATHWYISCHQAFPPISFPSPSPVTALAKPTLAETAASPALECESLAWPFGSVDPTSTMPPRAAFLEVEHVQSQLSRKALEHHQWVSCETSHVYETDLDCRWFFPLA